MFHILKRARFEDREPTLGDVRIHYNYVFDLGHSENPMATVRTLLKNDIALSAVGFETDEVFVADRFVELEKLLAKTARMQAWGNLAQEGASLRVLARKSPRLTIAALWAAVRQTTDSQTDPVSGSKEDTATDDNPLETFQRTRDLIHSSMAEVQLFQMAQREAYRRLFRPGYLMGSPFAMVSLQPFNVILPEGEAEVNVGLLVHKLGVGVLSFYVPLPGSYTTADLISISVASDMKFTASEVARPLLDAQARESGLEYPSPEAFGAKSTGMRGGVEWLRYAHPEPVNLADVFALYRAGIDLALAGRKRHSARRLRTNEWLIYPVIFVPKGAGRHGASLKVTHPVHTAEIVLRHQGWADLSPDVVKSVIAQDASIDRATSFFVTEGASTLFYSPDYYLHNSELDEATLGNSWIFEFLSRVASVQPLLVQRWILQVLSSELDVMPRTWRALAGLKRSLLQGLEEISGVPLAAFGTLNEILTCGRKAFGIEQGYAEVRQKLDLLERTLDLEEFRRRATRDRVVTGGVGLLTAILGLVGASDLVRRLREVAIPTHYRGVFWAFARSGLGLVHQRPGLAAALVWAVSLITLVLLAVFSMLPIRLRDASIPRQAASPSYRWGERPYLAVQPGAEQSPAHGTGEARRP